jgi:PhoPQ-activated pathogenicity-related protein
MASWGYYSEQIADYSGKGLPQMMQTEQGKKLTAMVDPYELRDRLAMPKLLINGTNDRYWTLDAGDLYFPQLKGPKWHLYVPNAGHSLEDRTRVVDSLAAFYLSVNGGPKLPQLTWSFAPDEKGVALRIRARPAARDAAVWVATAKTQDFRDSHFERRPMEAVRGGYRFVLPRPAEGFAAVVAELTYPAPFGTYSVSTDTRIIGSKP